MLLDRHISAQMARDLAEHRGLVHLFTMHGMIADQNPMAFTEDPRAEGLVHDLHGDVAATVDGMNLWLRGREPSVVPLLNQSSERVSAFMLAVCDMHRAAVVNVGNVRGAAANFGDQIIESQLRQGLKVDNA